MRKYTSPPQTYAAKPGTGFVTSLYTFPHTLGVQPDFVRFYVKCLVSDLDYPVGSIVQINSHSADRLVISGIPGDYVASGYTFKATPTDILVSFDTNHGASMHQYDAKKNKRLNNGAWEMYVKVFAP
jgi:hypothetical protein